MTTLTPKGSIPMAELTDAPNMQTYTNALGTQLDTMIVPKYSFLTDRDAANPAPTDGDMCYVAEVGVFMQYKASLGCWGWTLGGRLNVVWSASVAGTGSVVYAAPFETAPAVNVTLMTSSGIAVGNSVLITANSTSGFTVRIDLIASQSTTIVAGWTAII